MGGNRKSLGQYMTPEHVANLLAEQLQFPVRAAVDLASGDGALLSAISRYHPYAKLCGFEIDPAVYGMLKESLPSAALTNANGLASSIKSFHLPSSGLAVIGNPPFTEIATTPKMSQILLDGFPGITGKLGAKRSEVYFLARSLCLAKKHNGIVAILMPIGFADGDIYRKYRQILMTRYALLRSIEIPQNTFPNTEARTVLLVIDTQREPGEVETEVARYSPGHVHPVRTIYRGILTEGERLDARFHEGKLHMPNHEITLEKLGVSIVRGRITRKSAEQQKLHVVHSSDLKFAQNGKLRLSNDRGVEYSILRKEVDVVAKVGDILLPRTGTRVNWSPVEIQSGSGAITDHVFRIRAPKKNMAEVIAAFRHPHFTAWLDSITKGVCATVLTKRELLSMPVFS